MSDLLTKPNKNPLEPDSPVKGNSPEERLKNAEERRSRLYALASEKRERMWSQSADSQGGITDVLSQELSQDERDEFDRITAAYGQAISDVEFYKGEVEASVHVKEKEELYQKVTAQQMLIESQTRLGEDLRKIGAGSYRNPAPRGDMRADELHIPLNAINRDPDTGRNRVEAYPAQYDAKGRRDLAAEVALANMIEEGDPRVLEVVKGTAGAMDKLCAAIATDTTGVTVAVPTLAGDIQRYLIDISPIASYARIEMNDFDNQVSYPRRTGIGTASWEGEADSLIENYDSTYGSYDLNSYKVGGISLASTEALRSVAPWSLQAQIVEDGVLGLGVASGTRYYSGTGASQIQGVNPAAASGGSWAYATPTQFNFRLWVTFITSANIPYQTRMRHILCNKGGYGFLLGLSDSDGRPIFVDSLNPTMMLPGSVLGIPVLLEHNAQNPDAANRSPFTIVNLMLYHIRYSGGLRVDRSDEFKFGNDQVAFRFLLNTDGETSDANFAQDLSTT